MLKLILISLFLVSCSNFKNKVQNKRANNFADERVTTFMQKWKKDKSDVDEASYKRAYTNYLESVQDVFVREGMAKNIDFYLDSLSTVDDKVKKSQENFSNTADNSTDKTEVITQNYDKFLEERTYKLLNNYGFNFYSELMKNRNDFIEKNDGQGLDFPL